MAERNLHMGCTCSQGWPEQGPRFSDCRIGSGSPEPISISPGLLLEVPGKRNILTGRVVEEVGLEWVEMGLPGKGAEGKAEPWVGGAWICTMPPRPLDPDMPEPPPWIV